MKYLSWSEIRTSRQLRNLLEVQFQGDTIALVQAAAAECDRLMGISVTETIRLAARLHRLRSTLGNLLAQGRLIRNLARIYHLSGYHTKAARYYAKAESALAAAGAKTDVALVWKSLVDVLMYVDRSREALAYGRRAIRYFKSIDDQIQVAQILNNIGNVYHRRDNNLRALQAYEKAAAIFRELKIPAALARVEYNRANVLANLNRATEALQIYREVAVLRSQLGDRLGEINCLYSIGYTLYLTGDYQNAIHELLSAASSFLDLNETKSVALCHLDLAQVHLDLNLLEEAEGYARQASRVFARLRLSYELAKSQLISAQVALRRTQLELATKLTLQARSRFLQLRNYFYIAFCRLLLGQMARANDDPHRAVREFESARRFFTRAGSGRLAALSDLMRVETQYDCSPKALSLDERQRLASYRRFKQSPSVVISSCFLSALAALRGGEPRAAQRYLRQAVAAIERHRLALTIEDFKLGFVSDKQRVYELLVRLLLIGERDARSALRIVEQGRGAVFVDLESYELPPEAEAGVPAELRERLRETRQQLVNYYSRLREHEAVSGQRNVSAHSRLQHALRRVEKEYRNLRQQGAVLGFRQSRSIAKRQFDPFETVASRLPKDKTVIDYFFTDSELQAFVLTSSDLKHITLKCSRDDLARMVARAQFQMNRVLQQPSHSPESVRISPALRDVLSQLNQRLIVPLKIAVDGRHLLIVPHERLSFVPFTALMDGDHHLIDRCLVSFTPSLRLLASRSEVPAVAASPGVFAGDPSDDLPHIESELSAMKAAIPNLRVCFGAGATWENLRRELSEPTRVLHLAGHLLVRQDNPLFSALRLRDNWVNYYDLSSLPLQADLVVLSSCMSGPIQIAPGEELLGLMRACWRGNTRDVIASLSPVADEATSALMRRFYEYYPVDADAAVSYRRAVLDQRAQYPHPFYWSSFQFFTRGL